MRSKTKFKHFILSVFVTCGDGRDRLGGLCLLFCTKLKFDMFDALCLHVLCVCVCVCVAARWETETKLFLCWNFQKDELLYEPRYAYRELKTELTMWLLIGAYFDSVFHAAYRHGSSVGLCLRSWCVELGGGRVWKALPFGARLATRTSAYQWVGLRRHGSSWRHCSFSRPNPPTLHGPISKSCS